MNQTRHTPEKLNPAKAVSWCLHELVINESIDAAFENIVECLPKSLDADICFIFKTHMDEQPVASLSHWWKKNVEDKSSINTHRFTAVQIKAHPEIFETLEKRDIFSVSEGLPLHPDLEMLLESCGLSTFILSPVFKEDVFWGFIGLGYEAERSWASSDIAILQSISSAVGIHLLSIEAKQKLNERERVFEESLKHLNECTWEFDVTNKTLKIISDAVEETTPVEFNVLQAIQEYVHPEDCGRLISRYVSLLGASEKLSVEESFRCKQKDQTDYRWVKVRILVLCNNHKPSIATGDFIDVSEVVKTGFINNSLQFENSFLISKINNAVFTISSNNTWAFLNKVWVETTGYAIAECINKPVTDYIAFEFVPDFEKKLNELWLGNESELDYEAKLIHQNGKRFWVRIMAGVIKEHDKVTGIFGLIENMHAKKVAEQSVLEKEKRFRFITENISDCITIIHKQTDFIYVSAAASSVLGHTSKELTNQSVLSYIHPEDEQKFIKYIIEPDAADETRKPLRYRFRTGEDEYSWLETFSRPIVNEQGIINAILCSTRNIDERVRLMKEMEQALSREKTIYLLHQQLVTEASLDTKNKLSAVQASLDILKMYAAVLSDEEKLLFEKQFKKIQGEILQMQQTMNQLLLSGRTENTNTSTNSFFKNMLIQPSL